MKIRELGSQEITEVYIIYWTDNIRHNLIIPYKYFGGLTIVLENECEVIDPSIDGYILRKGDYGRDILLHWALEKDNLAYGLIDHDEDAMKELERRLREETPPYLKPKT